MPGLRTAAEVAALFPNATLSGDAGTTFSGVVFDSRKAAPGSLFVALRGGYADGHAFLADARRRGATVAVVEPDTPPTEVSSFDAVIRVANTRAALAGIASRYFQMPSQDLTLIGVTGTDGKTSTAFMLDHILRQAGLRSALVGTVQIRIGEEPPRPAARQTTPESLEIQQLLSEMRDASVDAAIIETTSHALAMHRVDGCQFDAGLVTNVTHEHLDFHGSVERYRAAKGSLLRRVAEARSDGKYGLAILNADDPGTRALAPYAEGCDIVWYSPSGATHADFQLEHLNPSGSNVEFTLREGQRRHRVTLPMPGVWNAHNALAAFACARSLGVDSGIAATALATMPPIPGRMEQVDAGQPFDVIVDYAHTPESLRQVLHALRPRDGSRLMIVFGSAGERDIEKRAMQGGLAVELADFVAITSEDPRFEDPCKIIGEIAVGACRAGGVEGVDFVCIEDRRQAIEHVLSRAREGDVVVLAGKGHERSMIYRDEFRPWNEADVAREILEAMSGA